MEKRTRGTNFSFEEKASLLYLVGKYFSIIENKRTDSTTSRIKDQVFDIFLIKFSCENWNNVYIHIMKANLCKLKLIFYCNLHP